MLRQRLQDWLLPSLLGLGYAAAFPALARMLGPGAESLATIVVLVFAMQRGLVAGVLAAAGCILWHFALLGDAGEGQAGRLATALGLVLVGAVVGRLRDLRVQLDEANQLATEASRAKSEFLARMSHEIRTPMHGVLGAAQVLRETELNPDQRHLLEMMEGSGELLLAVINDILDFSKMEAGRLELELTEFEPAALLREALDVVAVPARQKGLALALEGASDLPPWLRGDPVRLRQVLVNLLGNAVKFTPHGRVVLRARVLAPLEAGGVRLGLEVQDTGIGMSEATRQAAFEPFSQADASTTRVYGGTGLGLTISQQLVRLMGGALTCTSQLGAGTTFQLELELARADAVSDMQAPALAAVPGEPAPGEPVLGRVLVAEDNPVNQLIARRLLETLGIAVDVVADGAQAVAAVAARRYDVVLLDCQMPVLDGCGAAAQIRHAEAPGQHLPLLAVTAAIGQDEHERARAAGVDAVLTKPLRADELRAAVLRHLPRARRISQALAVAAAPAELPVLEVATLADLKRAGGLQTVHAVVAIFEDASSQARTELLEASSDRQRLAGVAHRQRGTAACVGARRLAASYAQLETVARAGSAEEVTATLQRVDRELDAALRALGRYRTADSALFRAQPVA